MYRSTFVVVLSSLLFFVASCGEVVPPLEVELKAPQDNEWGVAADATIVATLNGELDASSAGATFYLERADGSRVEAGISVDGSALALTPVELLAADTEYAVTLETAGISSLDGRKFEGAPLIRWGFVTERAADASGPRVVLVSPSAGAADVAETVEVSVVFDEPVDDASARAAFSVTDHVGALVVGDLDVDGAVVTLTPDQPLRRDAHYEVRVETTVEDLLGNPMANAFVSTFGVRSREWSGTELVSHFVGASEPVATLSDDGTAMVAWLESSSSVAARAAHFDHLAGWSAPTLLADAANDVTSVQLDMDREGSAHAVYVVAGTGSSIYYRYFHRDDGWAAGGTPLGESLGAAVEPAISLAPTGELDVVWIAQEDVIASRLRNGVWSRRTDVQQNPALPAARPCVAQDGAGNRAIAWVETGSGAGSQIWAARDGTSAMERKPISGHGVGGSVDLAVHESGAMIAVWKSDSLGDQVVARWSDASFDWAADTLVIDDVGAEARDWRVAIDRHGVALVVWSRDVGGRTEVVARFVDGGMLEPVVVLSEQVTGALAIQPELAMNDDGHAVVVWQREDGERIVAASHHPVHGWEQRVELNGGVPGTTEKPRAVISETGDALVVWAQNGAVWANRLR